MSQDGNNSDTSVAADAHDAAPEQVKTLNRKAGATDAVGAPRRQGSVHELLEALRSDPFYPTAADIVYWRDPVRSGLVFAIIALGWFLLAIAEYSVVSLASYLYLGLLAISFGLVQYSNFAGKPHPLRSRLGQLEDIISRQDFVRHAETLHRVLDAVTLLARDALFFQDVVFSLKVLGLSVLFAVLGNFFTIPTILFIEAVILFTVPRIYEEKKQPIDGLLNQAWTAIDQKLGPVLSKVPLDRIKLKVE